MKISIVVPCYNEEAYIGQAIGSVLEQSVPAKEIIVVDDGSTDRSVDIAGYFGKTVKILQCQGKGASMARNFGADHATGDAIMFLDADDVLGPQALESLSACLALNSDGIAACPWFRLQLIDNKWVQRPKSCLPLGDNQDHLAGWLTGWWYPPCSVLWSRTAYEKTGGWDPDIIVNQDGDLMMRALVQGINLQVTDEGSAYYRRHPVEHLKSSVSSIQFTHEGRESQIIVLKKISQKLADRGLLNDYRKPLTTAFNKIRILCRNQYPYLDEKCLELIEKYGEPRHIRFARNVNGQFRNAVNLSLRYSARILTYLGFIRTRQILGRVKNKLMSSNGAEQIISNFNHLEEKEIKFGLEAFRKASGE